MSRTYRTKEQARMYWQDVFNQWKQSGLSVPQFCRQHQIHDSGFYTWRKRLSGARHKATTDAGKATKPPFVQIDMHTNTQSQLTLQLISGNTLHIANQVNTDTLTKVVHALCEAKLC